MKLVRWTTCPVCDLPAEIVREWFEADTNGEPVGLYEVICIQMHHVRAGFDAIVEDGESVDL